jgi:hypothetical protein
MKILVKTFSVVTFVIAVVGLTANTLSMAAISRTPDTWGITAAVITGSIWHD